jgi:hypothetical protein
MRRLTIWLMLAGVSAVPGSVAGQDSLKLREPLVRPGLHAQVNASREQITGVVATVALSPGSSALEQGSTQQMGASLRSASGVRSGGLPFLAILQSGGGSGRSGRNRHRGRPGRPGDRTPGAAIGPVFSVRLTGVPAGRQYDLSLRKDYATVVQESRQPGNQDQNVSVGGVCGTSSSIYFVQVHRSSGLPTSAPFTLRFTEGT